MDDDKLRELFSNYNPRLTSDNEFMNRLERTLNAVEAIKSQTAQLRSRNRKAVAIAAAVGFIVGFLFSLALPYMIDAVSSWQLTLPKASLLYAASENFTVVAWLVIGATSVFAAINTYELSLSLMKARSIRI